MIFTITNEPSDLEGQVRVIIDTDHERALEILAAAVEIDKPKTDPRCQGYPGSARSE